MPTPRTDRTRVHVRVDGIVQGVGFRPYVHRLATAAGLTGSVGNDARGVFIEVQGPSTAVAAFVDDLPRQAPPLAVVEGVAVETIEPRDESAFVIAASRGDHAHEVLVSPDVATCEDCLAEVRDPTDRRYKYPFTNCTNCGPRFTIVRDVPYDRPNTTMDGFVMCGACEAEYHDPTDRRFHAQPVCCPACGPTLRLVRPDGEVLAGDPIMRAAELLSAGQVLALKGLGGYHLAVDATDDEACARLRARKHREDRPFAVMVPDLAAARALCRLGRAEEDLLTGPARPIVLAPARDHTPLAAAVAPSTRDLGLMLPYTPLHHLLATTFGRPFVLTSGNLSDEPIAHVDDDAFTRLSVLAEAFLTHDRPIHVRTDDSVVRVVDDAPLPVRRSRGYVPRPVALPRPGLRHVLACGAELKNTFALARDRRVFVSHHVGDLENWETLQAYAQGIEHVARLFDVHPEVVVHDLHPEYLSTKHAKELHEQDPDLELVGVQHHHAHVASCLADNGHEGEVIGVAFDGLGYGPDATLWGGEVLVADLHGYERAGHLDPVPMPGGAAAIREPWRMALAHLDAAAGVVAEDTAVAGRHPEQAGVVLQLARSGTNAPWTSSMGRLFDAVAAIVGLYDRITFEGQAAIALEQVADPDEHGAYTAEVSAGPPARMHGADLVRGALADLDAGAPSPIVAARFHGGVAAMTATTCELVRESSGLDTVALSGGVFQNVRLATTLADELRGRGFDVLTHHQVPPNDGGISLGQVAVANARDRTGP